MKWNRLRRRAVQHHLPLFIVSLALAAGLYFQLDSDDVRWRLSMSTGYVGLALVGRSLLLGPLHVLRERPNPVSFDLRRDVGIWAGILSLAHVVVGLQVHLRGQMWAYFVNSDLVFPYVRTNLFGAANYTGLAATGVLIMLLALSNDLTLRRLGTVQWKKLQRWNYAGFGLVLVHGIAYQLVENRSLPYVMIFATLVLLVLVLQGAGLWHRGREGR